MEYGEHKYKDYSTFEKKGISYKNIEQIASMMNKNTSVLGKIASFFELLTTPSSLDQFVYVFLGTYKSESEGKYYDIVIYKIASVLVKCYSVIFWLFFKPLHFIFAELDYYVNVK